MTETEIQGILQKQRAYFSTGATLPAAARVAALRRLRRGILRHEADICAALRQDLGKSSFESYACETGLALSELRYMIAHTRRLARPRRAPTPLSQFAATSYVRPSPYGTVLIMSPWNYPFLLTIDPLIDAVAAGNTVVVKPSAYSPATSAVVQTLLAECFSPEHVAVVTGGRAENACLLDQPFDSIFFTGGQTVGKEVLRRAAERLTPVTLELGGKSPCIVDETAKIDLAARRIVFGKFLNAGQTCVAPDYVLCQRGKMDALIFALKREILRQFGEKPLQNPDYGRIITPKHFHRICTLIDGKKVEIGGKFDEKTQKIEPTVLKDATWDDPVMGEEIFGPVLPVVAYDTQEELLALLAGKPKPLALYVFTENPKAAETFTTRLSFGGGCINDVVIHLATAAMPFGGIGASGMGSYHGKVGFEAFSHQKSIVNKKTWMDLPIRYQPYTALQEKLLHLFLR